jgi:hypothetical protein
MRFAEYSLIISGSIIFTALAYPDDKAESQRILIRRGFPSEKE